jgi:hypothetical protein
MHVFNAAREPVSLLALHLLVPLVAQGHFLLAPGPLCASVAPPGDSNPGPAPLRVRCAILGHTLARAFQVVRFAKRARIRLRLEALVVRFALRAPIPPPRRPAALAVYLASPRVKAERPRAALAERGCTRQFGAPSIVTRARAARHSRLPV